MNSLIFIKLKYILKSITANKNINMILTTSSILNIMNIFNNYIIFVCTSLLSNKLTIKEIFILNTIVKITNFVFIQKTNIKENFISGIFNDAFQIDLIFFKLLKINEIYVNVVFKLLLIIHSYIRRTNFNKIIIKTNSSCSLKKNIDFLLVYFSMKIIKKSLLLKNMESVKLRELLLTKHFPALIRSSPKISLLYNTIISIANSCNILGYNSNFFTFIDLPYIYLWVKNNKENSKYVIDQRKTFSINEPINSSLPQQKYLNTHKIKFNRIKLVNFLNNLSCIYETNEENTINTKFIYNRLVLKNKYYYRSEFNVTEVVKKNLFLVDFSLLRNNIVCRDFLKIFIRLYFFSYSTLSSLKFFLIYLIIKNIQLLNIHQIMAKNVLIMSDIMPWKSLKFNIYKKLINKSIISTSFKLEKNRFTFRYSKNKSIFYFRFSKNIIITTKSRKLFYILKLFKKKHNRKKPNSRNFNLKNIIALIEEQSKSSLKFDCKNSSLNLNLDCLNIAEIFDLSSSVIIALTIFYLLLSNFNPFNEKISLSYDKLMEYDKFIFLKLSNNKKKLDDPIVNYRFWSTFLMHQLKTTINSKIICNFCEKIQMLLNEKRLKISNFSRIALMYSTNLIFIKNYFKINSIHLLVRKNFLQNKISSIGVILKSILKAILVI